MADQYKKQIGSLAGKYFHSVAADRKTIEWQGKFLALASPGVYLVQLYEWGNGDESEQLLIPASEMRFWKIYDTAAQWHDAYYAYAHRKNLEDDAKAAATAATAAKINVQNPFGGAE